MFDRGKNLKKIFYFQETRLPCRPTNPEVKMTFLKQGSDISDKLEIFNFKYDPKIGLTIVKGLKSHHSGKYLKLNMADKYQLTRSKSKT